MPSVENGGQDLFLDPENFDHTMSERERLEADKEFMEKLLEAMTTPIDPRNMTPTDIACGLRIEIERAESEAAD